MQPTAVDAHHHWRARPALAATVRWVLLTVPLLASAATVYGVGQALPPGAVRTWWGMAALLATGLLIAVIVERGARRLLPIAMLLQLSLIFPDRAPSRLRLARAAAVRSPRNDLVWSGSDPRPISTGDMVLALVNALGRHDRRTRGHCERVRLLCDMLAVELKLDPEDRDRLRWSALLHDIGKVEVSPRILNKPSRLTEPEFDRIKLHPAAGAVLAAPLLPWLGSWGDGILDHHERYDGTGYPNGRAGEQISRAGRIIGLVDAFETMTAARPYKKAIATRAAREELARCAGSQFDPTYVRAFLAISLPRLLWAMGPLSFLLQLPFLQPLGQAGARAGAAAPQAAGALAAGAAGAAVLVTGGAAGVTAGDLPGPAQQQAAAADAQEVDRPTRPSAPTASLPDGQAQVIEEAAATPATEPPPPTDPTPDAAPPPAPPAPAPQPAPAAASQPEEHPAILSGPPSPTTSREARFELVDEPGVDWECQLIGNGDGTSSRWQPCSGSFTVQLIRDGDHTLRVRDAATKNEVDSWRWTVSR